MGSKFFTRVLVGVVFIFIGLDRIFLNIDNGAYKVFISSLAIISGIIFLVRGTVERKSKTDDSTN